MKVHNVGEKMNVDIELYRIASITYHTNHNLYGKVCNNKIDYCDSTEDIETIISILNELNQMYIELFDIHQKHLNRHNKYFKSINLREESIEEYIVGIIRLRLYKGWKPMIECSKSLLITLLNCGITMSEFKELYNMLNHDDLEIVKRKYPENNKLIRLFENKFKLNKDNKYKLGDIFI